MREAAGPRKREGVAKDSPRSARFRAPAFYPANFSAPPSVGPVAQKTKGNTQNLNGGAAGNRL